MKVSKEQMAENRERILNAAAQLSAKRVSMALVWPTS